MRLYHRVVLTIAAPFLASCGGSGSTFEPPIPTDGRKVELLYAHLVSRNQKSRVQSTGGLIRWDEEWITLRLESGELFVVPAKEIISVSEVK
jgi:hypothetical protein